MLIVNYYIYIYTYLVHQQKLMHASAISKGLIGDSYHACMA